MMVCVIACAALTAGMPGESVRVYVAPAESLNVVVAGEGTPVVLIPGLFGGAFTFRTLATRLVADGYRIIIVEPLGMGTSSRPRHADYSLTAQSDRIAAVLDSLHTGPVVVLAHSLGGSIAFRLAYRRPDLVRGILSLEGGPTEEATTPEFRHAMRYAFLIRLIHGVGIIRGKIHGGLRDASGDTTWVTEDVVRGYTADAARDLGGTLRVYQAIAHSTEPDSLAPHLVEIRCPVRMVVGTAPHSGDVAAGELRLLQERLANFAIDSVPDAGHYLQEERPDAVAAALDRLRQTIEALGSKGPPKDPDHADRPGR
jgi:pimeloyl-ACP methyl ester carboxylesterase